MIKIMVGVFLGGVTLIVFIGFILQSINNKKDIDLLNEKIIILTNYINNTREKDHE